MISAHIFSFVFFCAIFAGLVYGIFGGGSGLFLMPAYYFALTQVAFAADIKMQMAIATTAISTPFIALPALLLQVKKQTIDMHIFRKMFAGVFIGSTLAVLLLNIIPSTALKFMFGFFVIFVSLWLLFYKQDNDQKPWKLSGIKNLACTTGIGFLWFALGVAVFNVPYLLKCRVNIYRAIGTATFVGSVFGLIVGLMLMISGSFHISYSYNHIGFVNITFLLITIIPAMMSAFIGARISYMLPRDRLKQIYALLVFVVGIIMII